jgi:two-component system response regulator FixJ
VLRGIALGQPNKIIAYELGLSTRTVESYRAQLLDKLDVRSTAEAVRIALRAGLTDAD